MDEEKTKDGVIICKDGFRADTFSRQDFISLGEASGCRYEIDETDNFLVVLIIFKH